MELGVEPFYFANIPDSRSVNGESFCR